MDSFELGEIAVYQRCIKNFELNGTECEVVALPRPADYQAPNGKWVLAGFYRTRSLLLGREGQTHPHYLKKKIPPVDREPLGSWALCPWSPEKVRENV